jgi:hypothetical protein
LKTQRKKRGKLPVNLVKLAKIAISPVRGFLRKLLPHKHLAGCAERYKVKGCLAKVDAN